MTIGRCRTHPQAHLVRLLEDANASTVPRHTEWPPDALKNHVPAGPSHPNPSPLLHDSIGMPAPADVHQQPSPPTQTIDPNVFRLPPCPIVQGQDPRSVVGEYILSALWFIENMEEPKVGDPGVPECASQLAALCASIFGCFIIEIKQQGVTKYKCVECKHTVDRMDRALEHQRSKWNHKPFTCPKGW